MSSIEINDLHHLINNNVLVTLSEPETIAGIVGGVVVPSTRVPSVLIGNNAINVQPYNSAYSLSIANYNKINSLTVSTGANFTASTTVGGPGSGQTITSGIVYSYDVDKASFIGKSIIRVK